MNFICEILLIMISAMIVGILFLLFIIWLISQGLRNKFGPEWIPDELNIIFNHLNVNSENKKTIRYLLSEDENNDIANQIENLIKSKSEIFSAKKFHWIKNNETYEYRQKENNKLKAVLLLNTRELIYFK